MIDADPESIAMKICNTIDVNSNACDTVACCHTHWHKGKLFLIIRLVKCKHCLSVLCNRKVKICSL